MGNTLARHANVRVDKHNVKCILYTFALVFWLWECDTKAHSLYQVLLHILPKLNKWLELVTVAKL